MRRSICLLAAILFVFALMAGCGGSSVPENTIVVAVKRVRTSESDFRVQKECIEKYTEGYKAANPGKDVIIEYVNEKPSDISKYDIVLIGADDVLYYKAEELEDISKYYGENGIDSSDIVESALNLGKISGKEGIFYQAFNLDRAVVIADTEALSMRGAELPPDDWNFSDLNDYASGIEGRAYSEDGKSKKIAGIYMPLHMPSVWQYVLRATGTKWYDGEHVLLGDDSVLGQLMILQKMYKSGAAKGYKGKQANARAAMALCYVCSPDSNMIPWEKPEDIANNPGTNYEELLSKGTLKVLPLPKGNDGNPCGTVNTDFVRGFAVSAASRKKNQAAAFALYSLTEEGQKILNGFYGGIPAVRSVWNKDFWKRGTLEGENGDKALIGIEYDVRDDFSALLAGDGQLYDRNIKLNGLVGAYFIRDYGEGTQNDSQFADAFKAFAEHANKMFDGTEKTVTG